MEINGYAQNIVHQGDKEANNEKKEDLQVEKVHEGPKVQKDSLELNSPVQAKGEKSVAKNEENTVKVREESHNEASSDNREENIQANKSTDVRVEHEKASLQEKVRGEAQKADIVSDNLEKKERVRQDRADNLRNDQNEGKTSSSNPNQNLDLMA